ncbi:sulfurtransferase complex subunit TusB [Halorhodospira abdelmalekii]|uniref:sulfurtransferase complex subunit TusB n=1 Tax=Halorhodospira abdelmalekii TaxID=421629 RepID=UPI0019047E66|nr:sulfurtransferase complex subunit TusB [Halorhodospira abdelmalekii]MBK1735478.1 sulfurtransferase complex subunit TusB [Halorhodospira abdelmalekii]
MLHTVNKSPLQTRDLDSCLLHLEAQSAESRLLLIEDGVYGALAAAPSATTLSDLANQGRLYVLGPDLSARGVAPEALIAGAEIVDYEGFVQLIVDYGPHQAWV